MNKRQVKKLARRVTRDRNTSAIRAAVAGGSKKHDRRRRALNRWGADGVFYDRSRRLKMKIRQAMAMASEAREARDVEAALALANMLLAELGILARSS